MHILFNRTARLHFLLACVRLSLVFISLVACVLCVRAFGFVHNVHSLTTGRDFGGLMFASAFLETETFDGKYAKRNDEVVDEELHALQDKYRDYNDAWIGVVIEYYKDTSAPGNRGLKALKAEVIEARGLDSSGVTQFKHAVKLLQEAYEDSDCSRLPQLGQDILSEDGQLCRFISPDIMGQQKLLEYAERLVEQAELSAGRQRLEQFRDLIEIHAAMAEEDISIMSTADKTSLRGTVLYWQDVILNHFEKAERRRIAGLSSASSGVSKLQPRGNSLREDLVLTDGGPGLMANPEAGRFQQFPQYALRNSLGLPEPLGEEITSLFGKLIYLMTSVSRNKRPMWAGLENLNAEEKVKIMVTCVITGTASDSKGRLFIQVMETMSPYYLHKLTRTEVHMVTWVTSHKAAFGVLKKDPSRIVYHVGSRNEEESARKLDLSQEESWFKLVLSQRGLLIDHANAEDSEEEDAESPKASGSDTEEEDSEAARAKSSRGEKQLPSGSALASQLKKLGLGAPNTVAGQEEMQKLRELQVLSSLKNLETARPEVCFPPPKLMLMGGQNTDPLTGQESILYSATQVERLQRAYLVGQKNSSNDEGKRLYKKFCLTCNVEVFTAYLPLTGAGLGSPSSHAVKGVWKLPEELIAKIKFAPDSSAWFCTDCPMRTGASGKPLLIPGPGSRMACPGKDCTELLDSPAGRVTVACGHCGLCFGSGEVAAKQLSITVPPTWTVQKNRYTEYALALTYSIGGQVKVRRDRQVLGLLELLCRAACNPAIFTDHPPVVLTDRLIHKLATQDFCLTSDIPASGPVGLHLSDFQKHGSDLPARPGVSIDDLMEVVQKKSQKANDSPPAWAFTEQSSDATKILHIEAAAETAFKVIAWVFGENFVEQARIASKAASHEILTLHRQQFTPSRIIALYHSILADFFRRVHLQVRDWSSDQRYGSEIPPKDSEGKGTITMLYYRNSMLALKEVWGPETIAASAHANKAFLSVRNCSDSKPRKPSDSSTGLGVSKLEGESDKLIELPAPKPAEALANKEKHVQWKVMSETEKAKKRAQDSGAKAEKQAKAEAAQAAAGAPAGPSAMATKGKGKGGKGKGRGSAREHSTGRGAQQEVKAHPDIELQAGRDCTESAWQVPDRWGFSAPYDPNSRSAVCPDFQTHQGCVRPSEVPCPLSHIMVPPKFWPICFWPAFMAMGGHKTQQGHISWAACRSLLEPHQLQQLGNLGERAQSYFLQNTTLTRLNNMMRAVGEHTPWGPLEDGQGVCMYKIWGEDSPFPVASPSGTPIFEVWAATLGKINSSSKQSFALRGYLWDCGSQIECPGGFVLNQACVLLATAAMLVQPLQCPQVPSYAAGFILARQFFNDIAAIPLSEILRLKDTRLASVYHSCSMMEQQGLPDSFLMLLKRGSPKLLHGRHVVTLGQDPEDKSKFVVRLFLADTAALKEELWGTHKVAAILKQKLSSAEYSRLGSLKVLWVANLVHGSARHAYCFNQDMSFSETLEWLGRLQDSWLATVVIARIGMREFLSTQPASSTLLTSELREAHSRISTICSQLSKDCLPELVSKTGARKHQQQAQARAVTQKLVDMHSAAYTVCDTPRVAPSDQVTGSPGPQVAHKVEAPEISTADRVAGYSELLANMTVSGESTTGEKVQALRLLGNYLDEWLLGECRKVSETEVPSKTQCRAALTTMVSSLRKQWFGDRASEGPQWEDIEQFFGRALSTHHLKTLKEIVKRGGNPIFLGPARGYQAKTGKSMEADVADIVVSDYLALVQAKRGLPFGLSNPKVKEILLQAGVRMCPLVPVKKNNPDGTWTGKWRCCHDATDGGHTHAPNTGINSSFLSTQKCTNTQACARAVLTEEHKHRNSIILLSKTDLTKAFNRIANLEELIGMFASLLEEFGICFLNLVMVFGAGSSPGLFDGVADAIIRTLMLLVRPEPLLTGELPAEVVRYVDDFLSVMAAFGYRVPTSQAMLHEVIQQLLGEDGINMEKRGIEGTPQVTKQCFGGCLNTVTRTVKMAMSKGVKAYNLVEAFLLKREQTITVKTVQKFVGVCEVILLWAEPLKKIVCPRLYAILSRAALQFPHDRALPGNAVVAPMLKDEENEAAAWETLRFNLKLFFGLMSIDDGKMFQCSLEAALPRRQRRTYPGKEDRRWDISFVSDASGKSIFVIDLQTGRYILETLTDAEQKLFQVSVSTNKGNRKGATTINNTENLATLWAAVVLAPAYPGRMVTFYLDNATAEAMQAGSSQEKVLKDEQISAVIGLIGICMQISFSADRVATKSNVADYFTREELNGEATAYLERLETEIGVKPVRIPLSGELQWLRDMGWTEEEWAKKPKAWYEKALKAFDYIQDNFPQQLQEGCQVPPEHVRAKLLEALEGVDCAPIADGLEVMESGRGISEVRRRLTEPARETHTKLLREIKRLGEEKWLSSRLAEASADPMQVLTNILEEQHKQDSALLAVRNQSFDPGHSPVLPSTPLEWACWDFSEGKARVEEKTEAESIEEEVVECTGAGCAASKASRAEFGPALWVRKVGVTSTVCPDCRWVAGVISAGYRWIEKWNVASLFSGMGSFEEAAKLVPRQGVATRTVSDFCPVMQKILRLKFPEAKILKDSRGILDQTAELRDRLEVLVVSLPCVAFSKANRHARGTKDSLFTQNLVDTIEVISKLQPLTFFLESAPGIAAEFQGDRSVVAQLREQLRDYKMDVFQLGSSSVSSPLVSDGFEKSPIRKTSLVMLGYLATHFSEVTERSYLEETTPDLGSFDHILDKLGRESEFYEQMPFKDQEALEFKPHKTKTGVFVIGNITHPTAGRGEANFPNEIVDPSLGGMPCNTTMGSLWIGIECQRAGAITGLEQLGASVRRMSTLEGIRALGVRGLDNPDCLEVLRTFPAAARRMVGNAPTQALYDRSACQLQRNMSHVQPDGKTAWEKWTQKNKTKQRADGGASCSTEAQAEADESRTAKEESMRTAAQQLEGRKDSTTTDWIRRACPGGHSARYFKSTAPDSLCDDCLWRGSVELTNERRGGQAPKDFSTGARNRNTARKQVIRPDQKGAGGAVQPKCQVCNKAGYQVINTVTGLRCCARCEAGLKQLYRNEEEPETETDTEEDETEEQEPAGRKKEATVTVTATATVTTTATPTAITLTVTDAATVTASHTVTTVTDTTTITATDTVTAPATDTAITTETLTRQKSKRDFYDWITDDEEDQKPWASDQKRAANTKNHLYEESSWRQGQGKADEAVAARNQRAGRNGAEARRDRMKESEGFEGWPRPDAEVVRSEGGDSLPYPVDRYTGSKSRTYSRVRAMPELTQSIEDRIQEFIHEVLMHGKSANTERGYTSAERHWVEAFTRKNWDPFFRDLEAMNITEAEKIREKTQRCLWYVAYESQVHGIMGRSIQNKLSAVTWLFVKNYLPNPFEELYTLRTFMTDLKKKDPAAIAKAPATPQLLSLILMFLDQDKWDGLMFKVILLIAFWYMLRSAECLSSEKRVVDKTRVLLWRNVLLRSSMEIDAKICAGDEFKQGTVMTLEVTSTKNKLGLCTRTIEESSSELCAVKAVKELHAKIKEVTGSYPHPDQAICERSSKEFLTRDEVSKVLQAAALQSGVSAKMVASHSLRRGGATTYSIAGVPDEDIKRFGRWLSDAYKLYVFLGTGSIMSKGQINPMVVVPKFERN